MFMLDYKKITIDGLAGAKKAESAVRLWGRIQISDFHGRKAVTSMGNSPYKEKMV